MDNYPFAGDGEDCQPWGYEDEYPDLDRSDEICPCGDPDCSRPWGHEPGDFCDCSCHIRGREVHDDCCRCRPGWVEPDWDKEPIF